MNEPDDIPKASLPSTDPEQILYQEEPELLQERPDPVRHGGQWHRWFADRVRCEAPADAKGGRCYQAREPHKRICARCRVNTERHGTPYPPPTPPPPPKLATVPSIEPRAVSKAAMARANAAAVAAHLAGRVDGHVSIATLAPTPETIVPTAEVHGGILENTPPLVGGAARSSTPLSREDAEVQVGQSFTYGDVHIETTLVGRKPRRASSVSEASMAAVPVEPKRRASALPVLRPLAPEEQLAGTVQLSNKHCPRYYSGVNRSSAAHLPVTSTETSKPCGCPAGRCWYDAQLRRRAELKLAVTSDAWLGILKGEIDGG